MKNLVIAGAGAFGRELLDWCKHINSQQPTWSIRGFIDDDLNALDGYRCDYGLIGGISDYEPGPDEYVALAVADPDSKERIVKLLKTRGAQFATIIHPRALVSEFAEVGEGVVMYPNVLLGPNTRVGDFVTLLSGAGHDAVIEDYATVSSLCDLCGHVHIGRKAFIASHASIIPGKKVGDGAYVGAGSVVIRNVPAGKTVFGNPAKAI